MNEKFTLTGGARIGMTNATFPFVDLYVDKNMLKINASIVGNLVFQPKDIISIEPYTRIPLFGQGLKINHRIENYNSKVIFWTFKNPKFVISEIEKTGFLQNINSEINANDLEIIKKQKQGGFPIKKCFAIGVIIVWNLLFFTDLIRFFLGDKKGLPIGNGILIAVGLLFLTALFGLVSADFRKLILKEGRDWNYIKKIVFFIMVISGFMLLNLVLVTKFMQ